MRVDTTGLEATEVLIALYNHAVNSLYADQLSRIGFAERAFGRMRVTIDDAQYAIDNAGADCYFAKVNLGVYAVNLNVSLLDPLGFDATAFDSLYGAGAAQQALSNLQPSPLPKLIEVSKEVPKHFLFSFCSCWTLKKSNVMPSPPTTPTNLCSNSKNQFSY